ncbi:MAG: VCBS repeat-containing protein [Planctomycetota bacterium]
MKTVLAFSCCLCLFLVSGSAWAETPDLEAGVYLLKRNVPLEVQYCSVPTSVDWNNDGLKDLVVGQFTNGYIWLFLNEGTDMNPVFNSGALIESGGVAITTSYS